MHVWHFILHSDIDYGWELITRDQNWSHFRMSVLVCALTPKLHLYCESTSLSPFMVLVLLFISIINRCFSPMISTPNATGTVELSIKLHRRCDTSVGRDMNPLLLVVNCKWVFCFFWLFSLPSMVRCWWWMTSRKQTAVSALLGVQIRTSEETWPRKWLVGNVSQ